MTSLFSPPLPSPPPPPPPPPRITDPAIEEARKRQRLALKARKGRAGTIVTGTGGDPSPAPVRKPTLASGSTRRRLLGE